MEKYALQKGKGPTLEKLMVFPQEGGENPL